MSDSFNYADSTAPSRKEKSIMKCLFTFTVTFELCLSALSDCALQAAEEIDKSQVAIVKKIIREMPDWPKLPAPSNQEAEDEVYARVAAIEASVKSLYGIDSDVIYQAITELFQDERPSTREWFQLHKKVHLISRNIFILPPTISRDSVHFKPLLSVWLSDAFTSEQKFDGKSYPATWPWTERDDGTMSLNVNRRSRKITGTFEDQLEIFDYLRHHFKRRELKSSKSHSHQ